MAGVFNDKTKCFNTGFIPKQTLSLLKEHPKITESSSTVQNEMH
jgi:hypothetical protein